MPQTSPKLQSMSPHSSMRSKIQEKMFVIPSLITVLGLFVGFLAIISSFNENFEYAAKCIALAFILDGLDGRVARRLNATSEFGKEFDSLSDIVGFGIAPAALVYTWGFSRIANEFGILVAFLFVVCGATRLARFNIDSSGRKHFVGLPIPAAATALAAVAYLYPETIDDMTSTGFILAYTLLLSLLMVSSFPFLSIKHFRMTDTKPRHWFIFIALLVAITWYNSRVMILLGFLTYVLSGPVLWATRKLKKNTHSPIEETAHK